jgi:chromosome segregation ATPase
MRYSIFLMIGFLFVSPAAFGQSSSADSQTLQAILQEMRGLRQDLQTATVAAQRAQILLYRMQSQQVAVGRALQRVDDASSHIAEAQQNQKELEARIKQYEDVKGRAQSPAERKDAEDLIVRFKARLEEVLAEGEQAQVKHSQAEDQLRTEQAKLDVLQVELDRLDKTLQNLARAPANRPN